MDESSSSDNQSGAHGVALPTRSPSAESSASPSVESSAGPSASPSTGPSWERLSLALNRLESAILAKSNGVPKNNNSNNNEEQEAKLQRSKQETLEARRERDSLQKVVEATLGDIRALLK